MEILRLLIKRKHQEGPPQKLLMFMSCASAVAFVRTVTVETLLLAVLCSTTHCSSWSSNCGHLALCPCKLFLVFFTWRRSSSCFLHFRTIDSFILNYLAAARFPCWWWCRPHPVREHAQDLRPPLGARPASPPTRQAAQPPPRGPSTNPRPLV